mgnify:CR=1 FL=1
MPFTKGDTNINRSGRKSGSNNKTTNQIRKKYLELIENNFEQLEKDLFVLFIKINHNLI